MAYDPITEPEKFSHQLIQTMYTHVEGMRHLNLPPEKAPNGISLLFIRDIIQNMDQLTHAQMKTLFSIVENKDPIMAFNLLPLMQAELKRVKDPTWFDEANYL